MFDVIPVTTDKMIACGPASLKMLLAYYGIDVPLETLIEECNTRIVGCTASDIMRVARAHGLTDIVCYQMDGDEVIRQDRPAIIWWRYTHFCVSCGRDDHGNAVICNPGRGRYPLDEESFCSFYSRVAIFNGEPHDLPEPDPAPDVDPETADKAEAYDILMGVSE